MTTRSRARGDSTRDALVRTAIEVFGRDGYHATRTRTISAEAGVNQALIGFHFGGKEGLYKAALAQVSNGISGRMAPLMEAIREQLSSGRDTFPSNAARLRYHLPLVNRVTDAFVAIFTSEESRSWARLILREQQDPSDAFDEFFDQSIGKVLAMFAELIARAQGSPASDRQVRLTSLTIIGQALIFRAASAGARKFLGNQFGSKDVAAIQAVIRRNVEAMLKAGVSV